MADVKAILRTGAEALINDQVSKEIVQGAIEASAVLTNFRKLPNMSSKKTRVPVLSMLPVAYFVDGDTGQKKTAEMQWKNKYLNAEEIAVIVPIPEAVLDDSDYDIWGEVKPRLVEAFGKVIDGAVLFGVDKPTSWRDDILATATAAGAVITPTADTYKDIMGEGGVIAKIEQSGYLPTAGIGSISLRAKLRGIKDNDGRPIFKSDMQGSTPYALDGSPIIFPRNGAFDASKASLVLGDFSQAVYSVRQDIRMKIFTEGVVQNPDGSIAYNLMQNDMVALRATMRLGWEIPNPVNGIQANEAKRTPFAIYGPVSTVVGP